MITKQQYDIAIMQQVAAYVKAQKSPDFIIGDFLKTLEPEFRIQITPEHLARLLAQADCIFEKTRRGFGYLYRISPDRINSYLAAQLDAMVLVPEKSTGQQPTFSTSIDLDSILRKPLVLINDGPYCIENGNDKQEVFEKVLMFIRAIDITSRVSSWII